MTEVPIQEEELRLQTKNKATKNTLTSIPDTEPSNTTTKMKDNKNKKSAMHIFINYTKAFMLHI